jgi:hypothetical protein
MNILKIEVPDKINYFETDDTEHLLFPQMLVLTVKPWIPFAKPKIVNIHSTGLYFLKILKLVNGYCNYIDYVVYTFDNNEKIGTSDLRKITNYIKVNQIDFKERFDKLKK